MGRVEVPGTEYKFYLYIHPVACSLLYATTGNFLLNNYKQAIQIIKDYLPGVHAWRQHLGISNQDIDGWLEDERKFLESLKEEPKECVLAYVYVKALQTHQVAE